MRDQHRGLTITAVPALLLVALYFGAWHLWRLPIRVPFDFNEGWVALQMLRLERHLPLYPADGWFFNNYPPLSFFILWPFAALTGDAILAGRIVSLLAIAGIGVAIGYVSYRSSSVLVAAAVAGLYFVGGMLTWYGRYAGMNDPHLLAQMIMFVGVAVFVTRPEHPRSVALGGALMVIAGFVKHMIIGVPLGIGLFAWTRRREVASKTWLGTMTAGVTLGFLGCLSVYGEPFLTNLASPRTYDWWRPAESLAELTPCLVPVLVFLIVRPRLGQPAMLAVLLFAAGLLEWAVAKTGTGVDINAAFDAFAASCILLGVAAASIKRFGHGLLLGAGLALPLLLHSWNDPEIGKPAAIAGYRKQAEKTALVVEALRQSEDPVICEELATCYWADRLSLVDPFYAWMTTATGARSQREREDFVLTGPARTIQASERSAYATTPGFSRVNVARGQIILRRTATPVDGRISPAE